MTNIAQARILIIATNGFEQSELEVPRDKLRNAGAMVDVASPDGKEIMGWDKKDWGRKADVDLKITDAQLGLLGGLYFALLYIVLGIPVGRLAERLSRVNIIAVSIVIWSGFVELRISGLSVPFGSMRSHASSMRLPLRLPGS